MRMSTACPLSPAILLELLARAQGPRFIFVSSEILQFPAVCIDMLGCRGAAAGNWQACARDLEFRISLFLLKKIQKKISDCLTVRIHPQVDVPFKCQYVRTPEKA